MAAVSVEIPPRSPYVGVVRLALAALGRASGLDEEQVDELKIAVGEACVNSVLAHEEAGSEEAVLVEYDDDGSTITVQVSDRAGSVEQLGGSDMQDSQGFSSRLAFSVALLESLVDECRFEPRDGGGMITHLAFRR
ncbi:MAG TPA: ATP-binding protein [Actinomycetota bacterium]|nr:ATP-binding protein [Actinomycetota bacterium]